MQSVCQATEFLPPLEMTLQCFTYILTVVFQLGSFPPNHPKVSWPSACPLIAGHLLKYAKNNQMESAVKANVLFYCM